MISTKRVKIITENWLVPSEGEAIVSGGFRIIFESATIEFALATTTVGGGVLPVVNFSLSW